MTTSNELAKLKELHQTLQDHSVRYPNGKFMIPVELAYELMVVKLSYGQIKKSGKIT